MNKKAFKPLCDLKKSDIKERRREIEAIVSRPRYMCQKCARVAVDEDYLCKGKRISQPD